MRYSDISEEKLQRTGKYTVIFDFWSSTAFVKLPPPPPNLPLNKSQLDDCSFFTQHLSHYFLKLESIFFPSPFWSSLPFADLVQHMLSIHFYLLLFLLTFPSVLKMHMYKRLQTRKYDCCRDTVGIHPHT